MMEEYLVIVYTAGSKDKNSISNQQFFLIFSPLFNNDR